jgi:hypothetical protein
VDGFQARRDAWASLWRNVWLRAAFFNPAIFVAPLVALAWLLARLGANHTTISPFLELIPLSALCSVIATLLMALNRPVGARTRVLIVLLGLVAGGFALVLGFIGWVGAAEIACGDRYECPF